MDANEIRDEVMTMEYSDPRKVADALQHIAELLVALELRIESLRREARLPMSVCEG